MFDAKGGEFEGPKASIKLMSTSGEFEGPKASIKLMSTSGNGPRKGGK